MHYYQGRASPPCVYLVRKNYILIREELGGCWGPSHTSRLPAPVSSFPLSFSFLSPPRRVVFLVVSSPPPHGRYIPLPLRLVVIVSLPSPSCCFHPRCLLFPSSLSYPPLLVVSYPPLLVVSFHRSSSSSSSSSCLSILHLLVAFPFFLLVVVSFSPPPPRFANMSPPPHRTLLFLIEHVSLSSNPSPRCRTRSESTSPASLNPRSSLL
jgi:hypothetical protein